MHIHKQFVVKTNCFDELLFSYIRVIFRENAFSVTYEHVHTVFVYSVFMVVSAFSRVHVRHYITVIEHVLECCE